MESGVARGAGAAGHTWVTTAEYVWQHPGALQSLSPIRSECFGAACIFAANPDVAAATALTAVPILQSIQCGDYGFAAGYAASLYGPAAVNFVLGQPEDAGLFNAMGIGSADAIYSSTAPLDTEFPELTGINPHYQEGAGPGVNTNCVAFANAAQARGTGRDPSPVASESEGYRSPNDLLPSAPFGFKAETTPADAAFFGLQPVGLNRRPVQLRLQLLVESTHVGGGQHV